MSVAVDQIDGIRRVALHGRLDADGLRDIEPEFMTAATSEPNVVVDLSAVEFLASLGIRMLVAASQEQEKLGGRLVLAAPDAMTMRILKATGVDQLVPVSDTAADAAARF